MKIGNAGNGMAMKYGNQALENDAERRVQEKQARRNDDKVSVDRVTSLQAELDADLIKNERASRIEEIKKLVQSGEYFKQRSVSDIAKVLEERIGDEMELEAMFVG